MKLTIAIISLAFILCSCGPKQGMPSYVNGAKDKFEVVFLFEKDGIKVYRFLDNSSYHYFTTGGEAMSRQQSGKTSYQENIQRY